MHCAKIQEAQHRQTFLNGELQPVCSLETPNTRNQPAVPEAQKSAKELQMQESICILMIRNGILGSLTFSSLMDRYENVEVTFQAETNLKMFEWSLSLNSTSVS